MIGVARVGDVSNAEGDRQSDGEWVPAVAKKGAATVFCEGHPVLVLGSPFFKQKKEKDEPVMDKDTGMQKEDSEGNPIWTTKVVDSRGDIVVESVSATTVFAEGTPIAGVGDSLTYGLVIATGSETVFIN